ncbi:MAG: hypothetical protein OEL20_04955 [Sulfuritalea sp.]|nr:hypothetical protein [Sulfuritalea sp.]
MADGYLADDDSTRLRGRAPVVCRLCRHLHVKRSLVVDKIIVACGRPYEEPNADILGYLLLRLANNGRCGLFDGF